MHPRALVALGGELIAQLAAWRSMAAVALLQALAAPSRAVTLPPDPLLSVTLPAAVHSAVSRSQLELVSQPPQQHSSSAANLSAWNLQLQSVRTARQYLSLIHI